MAREIAAWSALPVTPGAAPATGPGSAGAGNVDTGEAGYPLPAAAARYTIVILLLIYTLSYLDRQVINILAEPIKHDLHLSDGALGALTGLAFALFYTAIGIPVARLADRVDRVSVITGSLVLWSAFTALSGMVSSFGALLAMRVGVGVGEAGCHPPATALIADVTPRARRASAMAAYALGNPLGSMLGLAFGGLVAAAFGWRTAFFVAGAPGILVAVLARLTIRDPRLPASMADAAPLFGAAWREITGKPSFWLVGGGAAMMAFVSYGKVAFYGSFFLRNHPDGLARAAQAIDTATGVTLAPLALLGLLLGILLGASGAVGIIIGGRLADRAAQRGAAAYMTVPIIAAVAQVPFFVAALFVANLWASLALLCVPAVLTTFWFGPVFAVTMGLVRPRVRSTASAMMQLIINIIGLGLGPLTIGLLSQAIAGSSGGDGGSLRLAMAISSVAGLIAAACFTAARRYLPTDMVS